MNDLEKGERDAREAERQQNEEAERVKLDLEASNSRIAELQKALSALQSQDSPPRKRARRATVEEMGDEAVDVKPS